MGELSEQDIRTLQSGRPEFLTKATPMIVNINLNIRISADLIGLILALLTGG